MAKLGLIRCERSGADDKRKITDIKMILEGAAGMAHDGEAAPERAFQDKIQDQETEITMKIAISATGKDLDSRIDARFGRCAHFIVVETDDMQYTAFDNQNAALSGSAGIQAASFVADQGAECVLTGNCGPKAAQVFSVAGITVYTGQQGSVRDAVERFKSDQMTATGANVPEKFGSAGDAAIPADAAASFGRGMGMGGGRRCMGGGGRGMGMGGGRGMGQGRGRTVSGTPGGTDRTGATGSVGQLKARARQLKQEMEAIESEIRKSEAK